MAIITIRGRAGMAKSVKNSPLHIAWGTGNPEWTTSEKFIEDPERTELFREIGRRVVDDVQFVVADEQGLIVTNTGRWTVTTEATNNLLITAEFDQSDGNGYTIREFGLFLNTVVQSDLPLGQRYFLPTEIADPGELLMLENRVPLIRTGDTCYKVSFVFSL